MPLSFFFLYFCSLFLLFLGIIIFFCGCCFSILSYSCSSPGFRFFSNFFGVFLLSLPPTFHNPTFCFAFFHTHSFSSYLPLFCFLCVGFSFSVIPSFSFHLSLSLVSNLYSVLYMSKCSQEFESVV